VADLLTAAGVDRVLAMDSARGPNSGLPSTSRVDHIFAMPVRWTNLRTNFPPISVDRIGPTLAGVERARAYLKRAGHQLGHHRQAPSAPNVAELVNIIGDVSGRDATHR